MGIGLACSREVWLQPSEGNMEQDKVGEMPETHVSSVLPLTPASSVSPLATWSYRSLTAFIAKDLCMKSVQQTLPFPTEEAETRNVC